MNEKSIYLNKMTEASRRINHCLHSIEEFKTTSNILCFETSVLQLRKSLESIAMASIAPNKKAYQDFREGAKEPADFRKDYNGRAIIRALTQINPDFYPIPLLPPVSQDTHHHFARKDAGFLNIDKFVSIYDKLGKHLHSDNPWGQNKGAQHLANSIPNICKELQELLSLHFTTIRTEVFLGVWVVEVDFITHMARIIAGESNGDFVVAKGNA